MNWKCEPVGHRPVKEDRTGPHNSHAHMQVEKRRHERALEHPQHTQAPHPSHHNQFFKSPHPRCGDMYPVGASFTAKHYTDEFATQAYDVYSHVGTISERGGSEAGSCTFTDILAAHNHWEKAKSPKVARPHLSRPKEFEDGYRPQAGAPRRISSAPSSNKDSCNSGPRAFAPAPRSENTSIASTDTGHGNDRRHRKPMDPKAYEPHPLSDKEHFFISQSKLAKAKTQHRTALKVNHDRWERIECGSNGHSAGGSVFSSVCHQKSSKTPRNGSKSAR